MGATAAIAVFAVVNAVMLRPLPYADSARLFALTDLTPRGTSNDAAGVGTDLLDAMVTEPSIEGIATYTAAPVTLAFDSGEQLQLRAAWVSVNMLDVLRPGQIQKGRWFTTNEGAATADKVVVLTDRARVHFLGPTREALDSSLRLDGQLYRVVGIAPDSLVFPDSAAPDVFIARNRFASRSTNAVVRR